MGVRFRSGRRGTGAVLLAAVLTVVAVGCEPGFTMPMVGAGSSGSSGDGGPPIEAQLMSPGSIVMDPSGAYFVVDTEACVIRRVDNAVISTVAGTGTCGYAGDDGPATAAQINPVSSNPRYEGGLARDNAGNLLLADSGNGRIRKIDTTGQISTVSEGFSVAPDALTQVAVTQAGTLYALTEVGGLVRVDGAGSHTVVGQPSGDGPVSLVADPAGGLFVAGRSIWRLDEGGTTFTEQINVFNVGLVGSLTIDGAGSLYAASDLGVLRIDHSDAWVVAGNGDPDPATGQQLGVGRSLALSPRGLAVTPNRGLLVSSGHVVYRIDQPLAVGPKVCDASRFHPGAMLSGMNLAGADLAGCDLTGADLSYADLTGADLTYAVLTDATIFGATVEGTIIDTGDMVGLVTGGLVGTPATLFWGMHLLAGYIVGPSMLLAGVDLSGLDLSGWDLWNINLQGANLSGANLEGVSLTLAQVEGLDLSGANVNGLRSGGLSGVPAVLPDGWQLREGFLIGPGANLVNSTMSQLDFSGFDFTGFDLNSSHFDRSNLSGANFSGIPAGGMADTYFSAVDLSGADLSGVDLSTSILQNCTLTGANITGTNLNVAYLSGVVSGGLIGTPSALPPGWTLVDGTLIAP